jgi:hypothetical protein
MFAYDASRSEDEMQARGSVGCGPSSGRGDDRRDGGSSSGGEASWGEGLRPINRAGYRGRREGIGGGGGEG